LCLDHLLLGLGEIGLGFAQVKVLLRRVELRDDIAGLDEFSWCT
jgi:hypothetical protein